VVSEQKENRDADDVSVPEEPVIRKRLDGRQKFYGALMLFVVVVGLPILTVPSLRNRLQSRVTAIKAAIEGGVEPVTAEIAEESAPFPEEYERYATTFPGPSRSLPLDRIFTARPDLPAVPEGSPPALMTPEVSGVGQPVLTEEFEEERPEPDAAEDDSDDGLGYNQGEVEKDAYALLLKSYPKVEEMVQDSDPALRFLSWGAVQRGEDLYWVRLVFQNEEDAEVEYIWQVEIESDRVLPLSHNARSIL
jgi:hypothetical protein